jgi:NitT/TauT family transport system substrate-binding protein
MRGQPIMVADATINAFWAWLRVKYQFENKQIRKYTFNLAPFLVDPKAIQQGYVTSEPYTIKTRAGIEPQVYLLADYDYPSYASMVLARNDWIESQPALVQAFVSASIEGWRSYVYGDPSPGNALIMQANPDMTEDIIANAISEMRQRGMVKPDDDTPIGTMSQQRWQEFFETMAESGVYSQQLDWQAAFTTQFIDQERPSE